MARSRREFSPQFKAEAVQFVIETGRPVAEVARELEISEGTLGNWVNQGTRLVGDITYLRTGQEWLYLASVIDLATRMVVGWQIADHM